MMSGRGVLVYGFNKYELGDGVVHALGTLLRSLRASDVDACHVWTVLAGHCL